MRQPREGRAGTYQGKPVWWKSITVWDPDRQKPYGVSDNYGVLDDDHSSYNWEVNEGVWEKGSIEIVGSMNVDMIFRKTDEPDNIYRYFPSGGGDDQLTYKEIITKPEGYYKKYDPKIHKPASASAAASELTEPLLRREGDA